MPSLFSLAGKTAIVTGGRGGLGQGIAWALAEAGADIVSVNRGPSDETAAGVAERGRRFHALAADLGDPGCVHGVLAEAEAAIGPVDILVNNAGTIRRQAAIDFSEENWDDVLNVNLKTAFFLSQAAARSMLAGGRRGKIINIASMLSFQGGINIVSYTASKHGLAGITKILANEWAARGINVNAIAPGYFATDNTQPLRDDPVRSKDILGRIPAGRWGLPADLGGAAVFLASAASDYIHGAILPVDGGWLNR